MGCCSVPDQPISWFASSGGTDKRPGYQELRRQLKDFNAVVIHSLSRLSRNKRDYFAFLEDIRKQNIDFVCITQKIDTTTPYGRAFLAMAVVWAELERELDAERAIQWIAAKQARGEHFGTVPIGYSRTNGELRLSVSRHEAKLVRQIFDLYGTGTYSDLSLARHLNLRAYRARTGRKSPRRWSGPYSTTTSCTAGTSSATGAGLTAS